MEKPIYKIEKECEMNSLKGILSFIILGNFLSATGCAPIIKEEMNGCDLLSPE
jgi:hypothetical protein